MADGEVRARRDAADGAARRWAARPCAVRARILGAAARALAFEGPRLAALLADASGEPPAALWSAEILPTLDALRWLAREGPRQLAPRPLGRSGLQWYVRAARHTLRWDPFGVVGIVTPGNAPLFLSVPQVAAALLAGNGVLWKPAPIGEPVARIAEDTFRRAGLPAGLLHVITGGAEAAEAAVTAGVDKLFFTGGSAAGRNLYARQAAHGRPAVLELSGRHVAIVLADADLPLAARGIAWGKLANRGRNCVSVKLVLAATPAYALLLARLRDAMASRSVAPLPASDCARLRSLVEDAVAHGARLLLGTGEGPTLLADVAAGMRVVDEEVQGPVLAVASIAADDEAVRWVNTGAYRLSASVWSGDRDRAQGLADRLDVGQVWINDLLHPVAQPAVPLVGRGDSGFGASRGLAGLLEMVQPKVISETPRRAARRHYDPMPATGEALFRHTADVAFSVGRARLLALGNLVRAAAALLRAK